MDTPTKVTAAGLLSDNKAELNRALTGGWMRVRCVVRRWNDRVRDEVLTDEVKKNHGVSGNKVGDFYKRLFGDARAELDAVDSSLSAVRTAFYDVTKKLDRDFYVAPVADMPNVIKTLTDAKNAVEGHKEELRKVFPQRVAQAQAQLGSMADILEYPNVNDVLSRMDVELKFEPIPDMRTFEGMNLPADVAATFASQVANEQTDLVTTMVEGLYEDLVATTTDLVRYFGNKAAGEKGSKLYDSKIDKIKRLARQLESAQGIVNTDFSDLSSAVTQLSNVDFDAAKASLTMAHTTHTLANNIKRDLDKLATGKAETQVGTPSVHKEPDVVEPVVNTSVAPEEDLSSEQVEPPVADKTETEKVIDDAFADLDALFN